MPLTEQEQAELRKVLLGSISIPLNSTADRVQVARAAVSRTIGLLSTVVSWDKPVQQEVAKSTEKGPEQTAPAPETQEKK